jgi:hypothetical protein
MMKKVRAAPAKAEGEPGFEQLGGKLTTFVTPDTGRVNRRPMVASTLVLEGRGA